MIVKLREGSFPALVDTSHTGLIPGHVSAADQVTGTMRPLTTMATLARGHAGAGAGVCRGRAVS